MKSFSDKQKLGEFSTTKPALQQMLKGLIQSRNTREENKIGRERKRPAQTNPKQLIKWEKKHTF